MFGIGRIEELIVVLIIILLLFGSKKLPELSKAIASSVRELRHGFTDAPSAKEEPEKKDSAQS